LRFSVISGFCIGQLCPTRGPHVAQSKLLCGPVRF